MQTGLTSDQLRIWSEFFKAAIAGLSVPLPGNSQTPATHIAEMAAKTADAALAELKKRER